MRGELVAKGTSVSVRGAGCPPREVCVPGCVAREESRGWCEGAARLTVKLEALVLDRLGGAVRLGHAGGGERDVDPAGEAVLDVPLALAVADQNQSVGLQEESAVKASGQRSTAVGGHGGRGGNHVVHRGGK